MSNSNLLAVTPEAEVINNSVVLDRLPLYNIFETNQNSIVGDDLSNLTVKQINVTAIEDIQARLQSYHPQATELNQVFTNLRTFNYNPVAKVIGYQSASDFGVNYQEGITVAETVIKAMNLTMDNLALYGDAENGNTGLFTHPNSVQEGDASVSTINQFIDAVFALAEGVKKATYSDVSNLQVFLMGDCEKFLTRTTNEKGYREIYNEVFSGYSTLNVHPSIKNFGAGEGRIAVFVPAQTILHRGVTEPMVKESGRNAEMAYNWWRFATVLPAVDVTKYGACYYVDVTF